MPNRLSPKGERPTGTRVLYTAQQGPQLALMESKAEEIVYGGAAGGGKSYGLRMLGVNYCMQYPGARVVLFRRTYKELEDTHISMLMQELPSYVAKYKTDSHEFHFPNGSVFMLRYCEHEEDVYSYDTFEADLMLFDELTAFSEFQYVYLTTRCRSTKPWWPGRKIVSATNPGNVGHMWVKSRFIDFAAPYEIRQAPDDEGRMMRQFIPAKVTDNPILMHVDPTYVHTLRGLMKVDQQAYRQKALGDWETAGVFFNRWRKGIHVVSTFTPPPDWPRYITADWGFAAPHAIYWGARPPGTNTLYLYREQYGSGVSTREQAIRARERTVAAEEKIQFGVADPAMWAKGHDENGNQLQSAIDWYKSEFAGVCDWVKGNNERVQGAQAFREALEWQGTETVEGIEVVSKPHLFVMDCCVNFIRTVPGLVPSKLNPEDVDTLGEDHSYDSARYLIRAIFQPAPQPQARRYILDSKGDIVTVAPRPV